MRMLVTGGTGFVGRAVMELLSATPDVEPVLLVRKARSERPLPSPLNQLRHQFEAVYADLRNFQLTSRAVREAAPDCVLHLAAVGVSEPFLDAHTAVRHNVTGTLNLLRACFEGETAVTGFVMARTPGETSAMNVYAASKAAAWQFCRMYARTQQWPIVGARIFQGYGPGQPVQSLVPSAARAALAGQDFPMTAGTQRRDWIYVTDVANGLLALARAGLPPSTTLDLGTGRLTSVAEVVAQIYTLAGGNGRPLVGALPSRPGEEAVQVADAETTRIRLKWETAVPLRDGLLRTLNALTPSS